ncbi:MAG: transposase [Granulosicoccus sp.]|jgi:transposase
MSRFIQGLARTQSTLFPECLDDFVIEDSAVRLIELFIDELNITLLGFKSEPNQLGRPAYHPAVLLKIYVYGYFNQIHSSCRLEWEAQRNIELMWLTNRLAPDFKTIADFRKNNGKAVRRVCTEFVMLCKKFDLFNDAFVAIDGSKFKAVNNRDKNFTRAKMKRRLSEVEASIDRYIDKMTNLDANESVADNGKKVHIETKIVALKEELARLNELEKLRLASPDKQVSLTDPDARSMKSRGTGIVGYNLQTAVDAENHLIVSHEVTNVGHDRRQLANISKQAKAVFGVETLRVAADRGYYNSEELKACEDDSIITYVPKNYTSGNRAQGLFDKARFIYVPEDDEYECSAGERLNYRTSMVDKGKNIRRYWTSVCGQYALKKKCTKGKERRVSRWEHEDVLDRAQDRLNANWDMMTVLSATVEHPFGTLKSWMGRTHFLTKTLARVRTEISLHVLAYNMKRMIRIVGIKPMIEAIQG